MGAICPQPCIMCCLNRRLVGVEPVAKHYEIQFLECPDCKGVVRLVQRRASQVTFQHRASARVAASYRDRLFKAASVSPG
jgi:hypothetical protein